MSALTIDKTEVLPDLTGDQFHGIAGEGIDAGQAVYLDSTDHKLYLTNATTSASATGVGIALDSGVMGQPIRVQRSGDIILGDTASPEVGTIYIIGLNGELNPAADLIGGWFTSIAGVGMPNNKLRMNMFSSFQKVPV